MREAAPGGETVGFRADKHQIEQRILRADDTGERRRQRDRFLKHVRVGGLLERVQHEGMTHEIFILIFLHNRLADFRPAFPVNMAERIAGAIIAQRDELF